MKNKTLQQELSRYFKSVGAKGGRSRSLKKIKASRKNGKLGGRPKQKEKNK